MSTANLEFDWYNIPDAAYSGQEIRLGVVVTNNSSIDIPMTVTFYKGTQLIGTTQLTAYGQKKTQVSTRHTVTMPKSDIQLKAVFKWADPQTGDQQSHTITKTVHLATGPLPGEPLAQILNDKSYMKLDDNEMHPGEYTIPAGSTLEFQIAVKNIGDTGDIWVRLEDETHNKILQTWRDTLEKYVAAYHFGRITINEDTTISVTAGHGSVTDDKATWKFTMGQPNPPTPTPQQGINPLLLLGAIGGIVLLMSRKR